MISPDFPVIDPSLPARTRETIAGLQPHRKPSGPPAQGPLPAAVGPLVRGGAGLGAAGVAWLVLDKVARYAVGAGEGQGEQSGGELSGWVRENAEQTGEFLARLAELLLWIGIPLIAALILVHVLRNIEDARQANHAERTLHKHRHRYVVAADLTTEGCELLRRAQRAVGEVLGSEVHERDLIDRQRNAVELPTQVWEIARSLADHATQARQEPTPHSERVARMLADRRRLLDVRLASITRRVTALEEYAAQAKAADARYAEWLQARQIADGNDELLSLLAAEAADELAVAQIEGMSEQAAAVARSFTTALHCARQAACDALTAA